jgi:hypothetical protein
MKELGSFTCPNGHSVPIGDGARFCRTCGEPLIRLECVHGHPVGPAQRYCRVCGVVLGDQTQGSAELGTEGLSVSDGQQIRMPDQQALPTLATPVGGGPSHVPGQSGRPSYAPTLIVTIFFGIVGLWPALRHSRMARERGYTTGGYWWAFWSPIIASYVLWISLVYALIAFEGSQHNASYSYQTGASSTSMPTYDPGTTSLPTESTAPAVVSPEPTSSPSPTTTPHNSDNQITAEMQSGWPFDPTKCGSGTGDHSQPYNSFRTYQVTTTVHLWSAPSTSSTALDLIPVTSYGPGGVGCPSGSDPTVTVECKVVGTPITGPFGTDTVWERTSWRGVSGYVTDEWLDTKWDVDSLPLC